MCSKRSSAAANKDPESMMRRITRHGGVDLVSLDRENKLASALMYTTLILRVAACTIPVILSKSVRYWCVCLSEAMHCPAVVRVCVCTCTSLLYTSLGRERAIACSAW